MDVLRKYLVHLVTVHPLIRVIGICFGHQIVAQAFGGKVVQDKANAEVRLTLCARKSSILTFLQFGVVPISLTSEGTELLSPFDDRTTWVRMFMRIFPDDGPITNGHVCVCT